uniref:Uncharacterized protein n=1 Tax=Vitis vinifera TaxID=29760 RepID=F6HVV8_VITVI
MGGSDEGDDGKGRRAVSVASVDYNEEFKGRRDSIVERLYTPVIMILLVLPMSLGSSGANYAKNLLRTAVLVQYIPRLYRLLEDLQYRVYLTSSAKRPNCPLVFGKATITKSFLEDQIKPREDKLFCIEVVGEDEEIRS